MASQLLSRRDINVLEKIKDPESNPANNVRINLDISRDPHIRDLAEYKDVTKREREIVLFFQDLEMQMAGIGPATETGPIEGYRQGLSQLDTLINEYPKYASTMNNRAQALRRLYGDEILVETSESSQGLICHPTSEERMAAAEVVLDDLDRAIALLSPASPTTEISPQTAKTLSMAYTQRAAIYHATAKLMASRPVKLRSHQVEAKWSKVEFEEAASINFAMGGRYGNEVAKGLAVSVNPTAKLCGEMVREAMRQEYGPAFQFGK